VGTQTARLDAASETWALIRNSSSPEDFESFAEAYPNSDLASGARIRAAQLRRSSLVVVPPVDAPRVDAPRLPSATQAGSAKVNPKDGLKYVWISPGRFMMGCSPSDTECDNNEKPAHEVAIGKGFWLGQTPVTQQAYQHVTGKDPSNFKGANLPVETVNWDEALAYCTAIGGRLPTEAEWEYAARAGSEQNRYGDIERIAWYGDNSGNNTHEVAQKEPNAWGLYDMLGNVWQWTADWYAAYVPGPSADPSGPVLGQWRALRGGSWNDFSRDVRVCQGFCVSVSPRLFC
jgi:formylglycine-generating enzyme required for sulfatase activity